MENTGEGKFIDEKGSAGQDESFEGDWLVDVWHPQLVALAVKRREDRLGLPPIDYSKTDLD
ncbi:hypothetical protein [Xanthomonas hortorum]|uniref:Uncharacterized protein n=2 Tax=Xanthomonas hortorum TaxID=56454 RepID=A0A9X4HAC1_9XANT|nr:hypothetical protein [Xanthomonas hortorum]MCE4373832.1 hypothetical protein [Xanthomonas hortorum pv. hederae]MDC8640856.1 hypothetical protein [Xanthomonas hortorum pv. hederae]WAH62966.1 hypothetical protein OEG85_15850 [Xanthomonas hortorum]